MRTTRELTKPAARLGLVIGAGLAALLVAGLVARPEMVMQGMHMIRGLFVGFGL